MKKVTFYKVHGSKNTFYLMEVEKNCSWDFSKLSVQLSRLDAEIDGLLIVQASEVADAKMRIFNADGSEASMCGNGLRCVARYVLEKNNLQEAVIETMKANLHVEKQPPIFEQMDSFAVEISPISFDINSLQMNWSNDTCVNEIIPEFAEDIHFTALSVPNPHLVGIVPIDYIESTQHQEQLATSLNSEKTWFEDGVNVSYIHPVDERSIFVRTFERGVGFTNACGTAMTASSLVAATLSFVPFGTVRVFNPGGFVHCDIPENFQEINRLKLIGNATFVSQLEGMLDEDLSTMQVERIDSEEYRNENHQYEKLEKFSTSYVNEHWSE